MCKSRGLLFRDVLLWCAAAAILAAAAARPAGAAEAGLKLEQALDQGVEVYDQPNPHFELECTECHATKPVAGTDTAATVTFKNGDGGIVDLCYGCHTASDNLHPIHVDPRMAIPPITPPQSFPLESRGANKGTVVCSTCHFIHSKTAGLKLLRGFPQSSDPKEVAAAPFKERQDLCRSCHGADLARRSPHKGLEADAANCSFCHAVTPKAGEPTKFTRGIVTLCNFCHGATRNAHFLRVNPFADPDLKDQVAAANLPIQEGGVYTCVSCHNPHASPDIPHLIRPAFRELASKSKRVNPHGTDVLCLSCHDKDPTEGVVSFKFTENGVVQWTKLCNFCHGSGQIISDVHPLKPLTAKMTKPADLPLDKDGTLNCISCHYMPFGGQSDAENPKHLRGGPFQNRNDVCWTCHKPQDFRTTNPHKDVAAGEGCTFCHSSKPREGKQVEFKGDIVLLCIRCHDDSPHPGKHDHTGTPDEKWSKNIQKDKFPLDTVGRMTCATCHNPHPKKGEQKPHFRGGFEVGMMICGSCHVGR